MTSLGKSEKNIYNRSFWDSVRVALEGIIHALQHERNMRIHFIFAALVIITSLYFSIAYVDMILVLFAISLVLISEMFNTAIEYLADIVTEKKYNPMVKILKDISAGAVFVAALNALLTGYILTVNRIANHKGDLLVKIIQSPWHFTLITIIVCVVLVFIIKRIRGDKNLLSGGLPSGHAAIAFAVWMIIWLIKMDSLVSILSFLLAFMVARSRVTSGIHKGWEVIAGSLLGALTALLLFQVLV
ncbi:MAG: diacylglycerol kinase [Candidatus Omnitrophica bacterium]|nr:diacylglycerol kinase [Candidatus Omnitrophota bacterium]